MSLLQRRRWGGISWWPESGAHRAGKDTNSSPSCWLQLVCQDSDDLRLLSGIETFCRFSHLGLVGNYVLRDNPLLEQVRPALKGGRAYKNKHGW